MMTNEFCSLLRNDEQMSFVRRIFPIQNAQQWFRIDFRLVLFRLVFESRWKEWHLFEMSDRLIKVKMTSSKKNRWQIIRRFSSFSLCIHWWNDCSVSLKRQKSERNLMKNVNRFVETFDVLFTRNQSNAEQRNERTNDQNVFLCTDSNLDWSIDRSLCFCCSEYF